MDRRGFLKFMVGGVAAGAAVRTWPFRVFSFPSEVAVSPTIVKAYNVPDIADLRAVGEEIFPDSFMTMLRFSYMLEVNRPSMGTFITGIGDRGF